MIEHYDTRLRFRVPKNDKTIGFFFGYLQDMKDKYRMDDYSASQTTLEQIFNSFAREDEEEVIVRKFTKEQTNGN